MWTTGCALWIPDCLISPPDPILMLASPVPVNREKNIPKKGSHLTPFQVPSALISRVVDGICFFVEAVWRANAEVQNRCCRRATKPWNRISIQLVDDTSECHEVSPLHNQGGKEWERGVQFRVLMRTNPQSLEGTFPKKGSYPISQNHVWSGKSARK